MDADKLTLDKSLSRQRTNALARGQRSATSTYDVTNKGKVRAPNNNNTLLNHNKLNAVDVTERRLPRQARPYHMTWHWLLYFGLILHCSTQLHAEPQFSRRYGPPIRQPYRSDLNALFSDNASNPKASAKEYLEKFGWVEPPDWTAVSPRFNETIQEGNLLEGRPPISKEEIDEEPGIEYLMKRQFEALSEQKFEEALKNFQQSNGLVVTGVLDEPTVFVMTQPRCGVPDQTAKPKANSTTTSGYASNSTSHNATNRNSSGDYQSSGFASGEGVSPTTAVAASTTTRQTRGFQRQVRVKRAFGENVGLYYYDGFGLPPMSNIQEASDTGKGQTAFANFVTEDIVSEAELSHTSRVESMESVLEELRQQKIGKKSVPVIDGGAAVRRPTSEPRQSDFTSRMVLYARGNERRRKKRSLLFTIFQRNGWGLAFAKKTITWRLVKEWPSMNPSMSANEVWFTIKLGFRMWSEILPRNFLEDNTSPVNKVDILIGFGSRKHNRCPVEFRKGPFMQEYAHAWPLPNAEIHFNDYQPFVPVSWVPGSQSSLTRKQSTRFPISLLKVAIHEIGHTLGLPHSESRVSVMNPYYKPFKSKDAVELGPADRKSIKHIYGPCKLSFDAVFDWVRQVRTPDGVLRWKFNTYFFRKSWYWLYDNRANHPRYGDPKLVSQYWSGVMDGPSSGQKLDGVVHVREWGTPHGPTFFFKGDSYIEYDNSNDRAKIFNNYGQRYPRKIEDDFPGIPHPIDTVFYKWDEGLLYFFKGNFVYRFRWSKKTLEDITLIWEAFPGWGGASPLEGNIDSTYYSYTEQAYYFFKGLHYWKMAGANEKTINIGTEFKYNAIGPKQLISDQWRDLCDVESSELIMTLPTT